MAQGEATYGQAEKDLTLYRHSNSKNNNIMYKNILTLKTQEEEPEDICGQCANQKSMADDEAQICPESAGQAADLNETWQMYMEYAQNALANLAECVNEKPPENINECAAKTIETAAMTANALSNNNDNNNDMIKCLADQLDRMEQMLREIYLCNQELCKSLLNYCTAYVNE